MMCNEAIYKIKTSFMIGDWQLGIEEICNTVTHSDNLSTAQELKLIDLFLCSNDTSFELSFDDIYLQGNSTVTTSYNILKNLYFIKILSLRNEKNVKKELFNKCLQLYYDNFSEIPTPLKFYITFFLLYSLNSELNFNDTLNLKDFYQSITYKENEKVSNFIKILIQIEFSKATFYLNSELSTVNQNLESLNFPSMTDSSELYVLTLNKLELKTSAHLLNKNELLQIEEILLSIESPAYLRCDTYIQLSKAHYLIHNYATAKNYLDIATIMCPNVIQEAQINYWLDQLGVKKIQLGQLILLKTSNLKCIECALSGNQNSEPLLNLPKYYKMLSHQTDIKNFWIISKDKIATTEYLNSKELIKKIDLFSNTISFSKDNHKFLDLSTSFLLTNIISSGNCGIHTKDCLFLLKYFLKTSQNLNSLITQVEIKNKLMTLNIPLLFQSNKIIFDFNNNDFHIIMHKKHKSIGHILFLTNHHPVFNTGHICSTFHVQPWKARNMIQEWQNNNLIQQNDNYTFSINNTILE